MNGSFDRDQARTLLLNWQVEPYKVEQILTLLPKCVRPAAIDRDDLRALLDERFRNEHEADDDDVDSILALVEPAPAGVTLSSEQRRWLLSLVEKEREEAGDHPDFDREGSRALAALLEADA